LHCVKYKLIIGSYVTSLPGLKKICHLVPKAHPSQIGVDIETETLQLPQSLPNPILTVPIGIMSGYGKG